MTKRGIARVIASAVSIVIAASSLGFATPARASTYNGVSGTIDCSTSGTITILNNVVTTHSNCSGSVEIPAGVMSVGNTAFDNAVELTGINVHLNNAIFSSSSGVLFNKAATALIRYPSGRSAISYTIPASATSIRRSAFKDAQYIQSVYVPTSVTSIQTLGFSRASNLATVYFLGNAPTSVATDAFSFVANGARAVIKSGATGFSNEGQIWNGLIVEDDAYTVTYNPANGSAVSSGSFTTGGTIQTAPTSTRSGHTLVGWSTSENGSVIEFPYSPAATTDITLFAIWSANTNFVFYNAGFGGTVSSGSFVTGGTIQTAPTSMRTGYTLAGWSTSETGPLIEFPYSPAATADITLYAIWSANTNTVTYNAGLGSAVTSDSFITGGTIQTAPTSTRAGYTFAGWATSVNGSLIDFPYSPAATSDITLFAIWSANTNTVTYNSVNGSTVSSGSFTTGGTIQTAPTSARTGYTFLGWSTSATGSVIEFPYSPAATTDITLYAIWNANTVASAPTISSASAGNRQITVNFTPPADSGGVEIAYYEYSTNGGSTWMPLSLVQTISPLVITGLSNRTIYSVKMRAINAAGYGVASNSILVMPRDPSGMLHSALPGGEALAKAMARSSVMASKLTFTSNLLVGDSRSPVDAYNESYSDVLISGHPLMDLSRNSVQVPVSASTISIITNVPKIQTINLDAATLNAIYKGTITMWDDSRIKAMNKLVKLPHQSIRVHYQSGDSDTSKTFFDFLDQTTSDSWTTTNGVITHGPGQISVLGVAHDSGADLATAMALDPYSLGFVQTHDVATGVNVAAIKNAAGGFMKPSVAAGSIFLKGTGVLTPSTVVSGTYDIDYTRSVKNAYPLTHLVYAIAPMDSSQIGIQGKHLLTYLNKYLSSNPNVFNVKTNIPLPVRMMASAKTQIESISLSTTRV